MGTSRGSAAALRAGRCVLPLAVMACSVLWMVLVLAPLPPELAILDRRGSFQVSVGEIGGTMDRWSHDTPPAPRSGEIVNVSSPPPLPPVERVKVIVMSPPMSPEGRARAEPPPPLPPEPQTRTEAPSPPPPPPPPHKARQKMSEKPVVAEDQCAGRYIYIAELPSRFNKDLLRRCRTLSEWMDMCKAVANGGMGPRLTRTGAVLPRTGWYDTNQFTLEVIFHNRMRRYECLTADASRTAAVYVPYYAGLDVGRHLWGSFSNAARDALAEDLAGWLRSSPAWAAHGGRDHFFIGGRIAWDLRREEGGDWGSRLLFLPEFRNVTALVLESGVPWHAATDVGVPYPTYFHPSRGVGEVAAWQRAVRSARRPWLFAFAGAPRPGGTTLRDVVIDQCARSRRCRLLRCGSRRGRRDDCHAPANVMRLFKSASFCLQPPGDSYTRRSAFDAMLAGCVPVFFHPGSAYTQYRWHLPADHATYSVFLPEDAVLNGSVRVEDALRRFGRAEVTAMRERVVRLIPTVVYRDPRADNAAAAGFMDAFDVAVDGVIERVDRIKRGLPPEEEDDHRWDAYFDTR